MNQFNCIAKFELKCWLKWIVCEVIAITTSIIVTIIKIWIIVTKESKCVLSYRSVSYTFYQNNIQIFQQRSNWKVLCWRRAIEKIVSGGRIICNAYRFEKSFLSLKLQAVTLILKFRLTAHLNSPSYAINFNDLYFCSLLSM